jgi:hypothetical protein
MRLPIYQLDAFTARRFRWGSPAYLPGPQKRGTGGTRIVVGERCPGPGPPRRDFVFRDELIHRSDPSNDRQRFRRTMRNYRVSHDWD